MTNPKHDQRIQIMRTIDKADRMEPQDIFKLLTDGRTDASGDFKAGCGCDNAQAAYLTAFVFSQKYPLIANRFKLLDAMETLPGKTEGRSLLDDFLDAEAENKKANPARNFGWALDDLWDRLQRMGAQRDIATTQTT